MTTLSNSQHDLVLNFFLFISIAKRKLTRIAWQSSILSKYQKGPSSNLDKGLFIAMVFLLAIFIF
jgi:hypothetical protein